MTLLPGFSSLLGVLILLLLLLLVVALSADRIPGLGSFLLLLPGLTLLLGMLIAVVSMAWVPGL